MRQSRSVHRTGDVCKPNAISLQSVALTITLTLMLVILWAVTHRYNGLASDGQLYAVQALAKLQPALSSDLYLQNISQDRYTIFSPIYAFFFGVFGLQPAELLLFALCTTLFLTAAGLAAREISNSDAAWLTVALLIVTIGYYGAYQIFSYSENYLTARSLAEALVVSAIACHLRGWRLTALVIAAGALFIHPLMTLPGLLLLIYLWLSTKQAVMATAAGVAATLGIALIAVTFPNAGHVLTIMDPAWLDAVRERSQFLFLKYWTTTDWEMNARPFVCLTLSALAVPDQRVRKLCVASMLVGFSGLLVAYIACTIGPVAILLQGQAWRWVWITGFVSVLLIVPTIFQIWRDDKCGPLCSVLLVLAWTYPEIDNLACATLALALWLVRAHITYRVARYLRWTAGAVSIVIVAWIVAHSWTYLRGAIPESGRESLTVARIREIFGLGTSAFLFAGIFWFWIKRNRSTVAGIAAAIGLLAASILVMPGSVRQLDSAGTRAEIDELADWRDRIPAASNVLIIPTAKAASFIWFTLMRPSYLTISQSAGVVFSPLTAQEVLRRSNLLLPVAEPDWRILSQRNKNRKQGETRKNDSPPQPKRLTANALISICNDPQLGFVIAKDNVGFDPVRHTHPGRWKDWNLYDCRRVRTPDPT
jgi:hypothetical protein